METYQVVLLTVAALVVVKLLALLVIGKGSLSRLGLACKAFFRVLGDAATAERIRPLLEPPAVQAAKPARLSPEPLRLLALLQREGRLLDFLLEDISVRRMSKSAPASASCIAKRKPSSRIISFWSRCWPRTRAKLWKYRPISIPRPFA